MATDVLPKVGGSSKRQQVFEAIQRAMMAGQFKPGQRLIEAELAAQMQVGSPTVREALIELEHLGFVTRTPNRGTFVTEMTADDMAKVYVVREALEGCAIRQARKRISGANLEPVHRYMKAMLEAAQMEDRLAFYEADVAFHRAMWELADNKYLTRMLENLCGPQFADLVTKYPAIPKGLFEIAAFHQKLMDCLTEGAEEDLEKATHIVFDAFRSFDERIYGPQGEKQMAS